MALNWVAFDQLPNETNFAELEAAGFVVNGPEGKHFKLHYDKTHNNTPTISYEQFYGLIPLKIKNSLGHPFTGRFRFHLYEDRWPDCPPPGTGGGDDNCRPLNPGDPWIPQGCLDLIARSVGPWNSIQTGWWACRYMFAIPLGVYTFDYADYTPPRPYPAGHPKERLFTQTNLLDGTNDTVWADLDFETFYQSGNNGLYTASTAYIRFKLEFEVDYDPPAISDFWQDFVRCKEFPNP